MEAPSLSKRGDLQGNIVGVDPHKWTLSAAVLDHRGGLLAQSHFNVSDEGHRALEQWALSFGPIARWGVEGANGIGRHATTFLCTRGHDVRDVAPNRTAERNRLRRQGKSDALDSDRIAREVLAYPDVPLAFKRAGDAPGPDQHSELLALWHKERRSINKHRQQLLTEAESLLGELPEDIRDRLPKSKKVRTRLTALARLGAPEQLDGATAVRLELLTGRAKEIAELDARDKETTGHLTKLIERSGSTLAQLTGLSTRSVAEILVEVGDPRRFTEGGLARFNGTAPLPASSAEGPGKPIRHRLNRGGNRRLNKVLHLMAVTQLRGEPRAQDIYADARRRGKSKKEAMRTLKRNLSNVVHRRMVRDFEASRPLLRLVS